MRSFTIKNISALLLLTFGLMVWGSGMVKGQATRIYADKQRSQTTLGGSVTGAANCVDASNLTDFTNLRASSLVLSQTASIQLIFPTSLQVGCPVYVQIGNHGVALLGGGISAKIYSGSSTSQIGTPVTDITTPTVSSLSPSLRSIKTTPNASFNSIMITLAAPAVAGENEEDVYFAFYVPAPTVTATPATPICSGSEVLLEVSSPNVNMIYNWYTEDGTLVNTGKTYTPHPIQTTKYYVEAQEATSLFVSAKVPITVNVTPLPTLTVSQSKTSIPIGGTNTLTAISTTSGATIIWYDGSGTPVNPLGGTVTVGSNLSAGTYTYNAIVTSTCTINASLTFTVYSPTDCPILSNRIYARQTSSASSTGAITQASDAYDGNPKTFSTITSGLVLLGLGTVKQDLIWTNEVAKGKPAIVKIATGSDVLALASGASIIGLKRTGPNTFVEIGTLQSMNTALLNLLSGENIFEYSYVPSDASGPKAYDGIRVVLGAGLLGAGQTIKLYDAYYEEPTTTLDCSKGDVIDILAGAQTVGLGVVSGTVNVSNPWNAVDGNDNTYATLTNNVGVLAYAKQQIVFSSPSSTTDSIKIITSTGASLLNIDLLSGFSIQLYMGTVPVGAPIKKEDGLLTLKLLSGNTKAAIILTATPQPYDRIEIRFGSVVGVLSSIFINEVQRIATTKITTSDLNNRIVVCAGQNVTLPSPGNNCTTFEWYDAPTGGTKIATGLVLPTSTSSPAQKTYYIQPIRYGCSLMSRGMATVIVNPHSGPPNVSISSN